MSDALVEPDAAAKTADAARAELAAREVAASPESGVPSLRERFWGVLLAPVQTFKELDGSWGWAGPWFLVALAGTAKGALRVAMVDISAKAATESQLSLSLLSDQMRRAHDESMKGKDSFVGEHMNAFMEKTGEIVGPALGSILAIVAVGLVLFAASWALGGKRDILKSIVVSAHAKMVLVVGYAAAALGTLLGNPVARTDLGNVASFGQYVSMTACSLADPIALWHTVLLAVGMVVALEVPRRRAIAFTVSIQGLAWLVSLVPAVLATAAMNSMKAG